MGGKKTRPQTFQQCAMRMFFLEQVRCNCMISNHETQAFGKESSFLEHIKTQTKGKTLGCFDNAVKCVVTMQTSHYAMLQDTQGSLTQSCYSTNVASTQLILNGLKHIAIQPILVSTDTLVEH